MPLYGPAAVVLLLTLDGCAARPPQPKYAVAYSQPATGRFLDLCFDRRLRQTEHYEATMTLRWPPGSLTCEVLLRRGAGLERKLCVGYSVDALCHAPERPRSPEYRASLIVAFEKAPELTVRIWEPWHEDQAVATTIPVLR